MKGARPLEHSIGGKVPISSVDREIWALAEAQHGVVSRRQLLDLGIGRRAVEHRLARARLHVIHRGVYAVGHRRISREARWLSAVLAAGDGAALSHGSAAALIGLRPSATALVHVTAARRIRGFRGIVFHRRSLPADEITVLEDVPVTTVPRTLLDLASVLNRRQVERAMEEADRRRLDDPLSLLDLLSRYPRRPGTAKIRAILEVNDLGSTFTRSELEEAFLGFIRAYSLPSPELNIDLELSPGRWIEADCAWRAQRVIVELDSRAFHRTIRAFESDRARDRAATVAGWTVIRVTWCQLHDEPDALHEDIGSLLTRAAAHP